MHNVKNLAYVVTYLLQHCTIFKIESLKLLLSTSASIEKNKLIELPCSVIKVVSASPATYCSHVAKGT